MRTITVFLLTLWATALGAVEYTPSRLPPPKPPREYRAAWIATVANIDWPSTNATTPAEQKAELVAIMDRAAQLKLNTLIFQVRPACDALYASPFEPWSEYLTGTMGKPPEPFYDPLTFAIEEAHKRGMELHAWFNPYRARHNAAKSPIASNHISRTHPELVRHYGKFLWLDPGEKAVQDYSLNVIMDVVKRYDIDGVHFDDYFYPYKEKDAAGRELDFPDDASWKRYGAGGKLNREDWRRENVNVFLERVYKSIKATKPWVRFGISPFGIWRPGFPAQVKGFDSYAKLYADSRKWLANGWLDYCAPQLYWAIKPPEQSFPVLLQWWAEQNPKGRHLVPGMDTTKIGGKWKPEEIVSQIRLTRKQSGGSGHIHWNMKSLMRNPALDATLEREVYAEPALVPAATWLNRSRPRKPQLSVCPASGCLQVQWSTVPNSEKASLWVLQTRHGQHWTTELLPALRTSVELGGPVPDAIAVTPVDRYGNAGTPAVVERKDY